MAVKPEDDELHLPAIGHVMQTLPGQPDSALKAKRRETRGLRQQITHEYRDPSHTTLAQIDFELNNETPADTFSWLVERANAVLRRSSERNWFDVMASIGDSMAPSGVEGVDAGTLGLMINHRQIAERRGELSREATASRFLMINDMLAAMVGGGEDKHHLLYQWADAYFWARMEERHYHYFAVEGLKAMGGRKAGPEKRAAKAALKMQIVREEHAKMQASSTSVIKLEAAAELLVEPLGPRFEAIGERRPDAGQIKTYLTRQRLVSTERARRKA